LIIDRVYQRKKTKSKESLCGLPVDKGELETIDKACKGLTQIELQAQYLGLLARLEKVGANSGAQATANVSCVKA